MCDVYRSQSRSVTVILSQSRSITVYHIPLVLKLVLVPVPSYLRRALTLLLVGFLEDVNWWGGRFAPPPPWDLENRKADFDWVNAIRFLSSWTTSNPFSKIQKIRNLGFRGPKITIAVFHQMFKIVITSLFLERFRPNFRTSFSINKSITNNQFFTVSENLKKKLVEAWQTCPRESGPGGASAQSRNSKIWYNISNECVWKVKKFQVPILSRFP